MNWNSWADFFHMGGYAFYVWGSFGMTGLLVAGELFFLGRYRRQALRRAQRAVRFDPSRGGGDEDAA